MSRVSVALRPTDTTSNSGIDGEALRAGDRRLQIERGDAAMDGGHAAAALLGIAAGVFRLEEADFAVKLLGLFDPGGREAVIAKDAVGHALRGVLVGVFVERE